MLIVTPEDPSYIIDKAILNGRIPSNPAAILYCYNTDDIIAAIHMAKKDKKKIRIRSTGHSYEGFCTGDATTYIIDVSNINSCSLSTDKKTARIGGGAQLYRDIYLPLWNEGRVSIPGGSCPTVGISGLFTGGGFSFSGRKYGLTTDSVIEIEIITSDGTVHTVNTYNKADLFWALRGAGNGNFGVISACTLNCFPAEDVSIYRLEWDVSQGFYSPMDKWFEFMASTPPELMTFFKINKSNGKIQLSSFGQFYGNQTVLENMVNSRLGTLPLVSTPTFDTLRNIDAIRHWGGIKEKNNISSIYMAHNINQTSDSSVDSIGDEVSYFKASSLMLTNKPDPNQIQKVEEIFENHANNCFLVLDSQQGGISNSYPKDYNAYAHRNALCSAQIYSNWTDDNPDNREANIKVVEELRKVIKSAGEGAYINYCDLLLEDWPSAYYGAHFQYLQQIKRKYDPENIFSYPQSIPPSK